MFGTDELVDDPVAAIRALVGRLADEDRSDWSGAARSEGSSGLVQAAERLQAEVLRAVGEWDAISAWGEDGGVSPVAWLTARAPVTKCAAARLVRSARLVRTHEPTAAALARDEVSVAHVEVMASAIRHREDVFASNTANRCWMWRASSRPSSSGTAARQMAVPRRRRRRDRRGLSDPDLRFITLPPRVRRLRGVAASARSSTATPAPPSSAPSTLHDPRPGRGPVPAPHTLATPRRRAGRDLRRDPGPQGTHRPSRGQHRRGVRLPDPGPPSTSATSRERCARSPASDPSPAPSWNASAAARASAASSWPARP